MTIPRHLAGERMQRILRFAAVGVAATATDFATFNLGIAMVETPGRAYIVGVNTVAFAVATAVSYLLNSRFTFGGGRGRAALMRYGLVALGGALVYDGSLLALLQVLPPSDTLLLNAAKAGAVTLSATWNFIGFSTFAFTGRRVAEDVGVAT